MHSTMLDVNGNSIKLFSQIITVDSDRMMLLKNGEYNSLWQLIGTLKPKEPKTIPLPLHPRPSSKEGTPHVPISPEPPQSKTLDVIPPSSVIDRIPSEPKLKFEEKLESKPEINNVPNLVSGDHQLDDSSMAMIENHQKRHAFAPSLYEAEQNYRELRRLLKKINKPKLNEQKTQKRSTNSNQSPSKRNL